MYKAFVQFKCKFKGDTEFEYIYDDICIDLNTVVCFNRGSEGTTIYLNNGESFCLKIKYEDFFTLINKQHTITLS